MLTQVVYVGRQPQGFYFTTYGPLVDHSRMPSIFYPSLLFLIGKNIYYAKRKEYTQILSHLLITDEVLDLSRSLWIDIYVSIFSKSNSLLASFSL